MFGDGSLTFQEFMTRERVPLATVHDAVLEFLRGRKDAVLCGAQLLGKNWWHRTFRPRVKTTSF
jgi:hypothetical protein